MMYVTERGQLIEREERNGRIKETIVEGLKCSSRSLEWLEYYLIENDFLEVVKCFGRTTGFQKPQNRAR